MNTSDMSNPLDPASEAVLRVQREVLLKLGAELMAAQRVALAGVQAEMDLTSRALSETVASWRGRMLEVISISTRLLLPWLVVLSVLAVATLILGAQARNAWVDYRAAKAAAESLRVHGAMTVVRDGKLYVRVDPDSLFQGKLGNWYAQAVTMEFREDRGPGER